MSAPPIPPSVSHLDHPARSRAIGARERPPAPIAVAALDLDDPQDLDFGGRAGALVVVFSGGRPVGEMAFRAVPGVPGRVPAERLRDAAREALRPVLVAAELDRRLRPRVGGDWIDHVPAVSVSVVIPTRDRREHVTRCLAALSALDPAPDEILVVDNAPHEPCEDLAAAAGARYLSEPRPGANHARRAALAVCRTELVAFIDDDCRPTPAWLGNVARHFFDPLMAVVAGPAPPAILETDAQVVFEAAMGFTKGYEPRSYDWSSLPPLAAGAVGASNNMVVRVSAGRRLRLLAPELGAGTPAAGGEDQYAVSRALAAGLRVMYDPAQLVWHVHRADAESLARQMHGYGRGLGSLFVKSIVEHRELTAVPLSRWPLSHLREQVAGVRHGTRGWADVEAAARFLGGIAVSVPAWRRSRRINGRDAPTAPSPPPDRPRSGPRPVDPALPRITVVALTAGAGRAAESGGDPAEGHELIVAGLDPAAVRTALDAASGDVVVMIGAEIVPEPGAIAELARGAVAGQCAVVGRNRPATAGRTLAQNVWAWSAIDRVTRRMRPGYSPTFADLDRRWFAIARSDLDAVGWPGPMLAGTDRHLDWELALRCRSRGLVVRMHASAVAWDHTRVTDRSLLAERRAGGRGDLLMVDRHPDLVAATDLPMLLHPGAIGSRRWRAQLLAARSVLDGGVPSPLHALRALEAGRLRSRWAAAFRRLSAACYLLGVSDALDDDVPVPELWGPPTSIDLDGRAPVDVPPVPGTFVLTSGGSEIASGAMRGGWWSPEEILRAATAPPAVAALRE